MQQTTYEKGWEEGREEGLEKGLEKGIEEGAQQAECRFLVMLLEEKFGGVSQRVRKKIERMTSDERGRIAKQALSAQSLKDLQL